MVSNRKKHQLITSLKIINYALIDNLDISFTDGLSCITGETGAGKSILMGGLSLVLGERADLNVLKDPNKKCVIEATFYIENYSLREFFDEAQIDYQKETLLRREIIPGGKSRAFINDSPVTLEKINREMPGCSISVQAPASSFNSLQASGFILDPNGIRVMGYKL